MRKHVPPTITRVGSPGRDEEVVETHPSYAMISLGRYTCMPAQNFFGSAIKHHAGISLRIRLAEKHRNLSNDWYFGKQEVIEVNMTAAQLADLLTSMNIGDGVPCTLTHLAQSDELQAQYPDPMVPPCPETTMRQQYEDEFKKDMRQVAEGIAKLVQMARVLQEKPSINKADRKQFADIADTIKCKIENSIPFVQGQFNEALDKVLTEAKADLESFTDQLAHSLGSEALAAQIKGAKPDLQLPLGGGEDYTSKP